MAPLHSIFVDGLVTGWAKRRSNRKTILIAFSSEVLFPVPFAVGHFGLPCRVSVKGYYVTVEEKSASIV